MCAGESQWQNGILERHIGTLKTLLDKLILEGEATTDAASASVCGFLNHLDWGFGGFVLIIQEICFEYDFHYENNYVSNMIEICADCNAI